MEGEDKKIGSPVQAHVIKQLDQRAALYSKPEKEHKDLMTLHENAVWVQLRSSVNQITEEEADQLETSIDPRTISKGMNTVATQYVLLAGTTSAISHFARGGISFEPGYINSVAAYNNYDSLGFRPMPGITGFKATSKNTFGSLMEAEVNFVVWTLEDLEACELLYFRPGYTALLEWGHTIYLDNSGQMVTTTMDNHPCVPADDFFFKEHNTEVAEHPIDKIVQEIRVSTCGNYDGMFGYITNFSFTFRADGGYDCSVKIVSKGVILDSLKAAKPSDKTPTKKSTKAESNKRKNKSIYHHCFYYLEKDPEPGAFFDGKSMIEKNEKEDKGTLSTYLDPFNVYTAKVDLNGQGRLGMDKSINAQYISLRSLAMLVNNLNAYQNPFDNPLKAYKSPFISLDFGMKYLTCPDHYSIDPMVALPPKIPVNSPYINFHVVQRNLHKKMQEEVSKQDMGGPDDVLNLMVSTFFLENTLNSLIEGAQESETSIFDFIKAVLKGVSVALGDVNDLDLFHDTISDHYIIVDRNNLGDLLLDRIPIINVTGLSSTISSMNVSSKVSSAVAAQVAIAAQGNQGNYKENVATILEWNRGAIDRHIPIRTNNSSKTQKEADDRKSNVLEDLKDLWEDFNASGNSNNYDASNFENLRAEASANIQGLCKLSQKQSGKAQTGVVPVELSLTMLGIQGLVVGTVFRINYGILPSKYDNWAFIITGMEHTISSDNKWTTTVKTQFFSTKAPSATVQKNAKKEGGNQPNPYVPPPFPEKGDYPDGGQIIEVLQVGMGYNIVRMADGVVVRRKGNFNWRNNNPGNIENGSFAKSAGALTLPKNGSGLAARFAIFPTYEIGRSAKARLLFESPGYRNLSVSQAIARYAPPSENNTRAYQQQCIAAVGGDFTMRMLTDPQRKSLLDTMQRIEGYKVGLITKDVAPFK